MSEKLKLKPMEGAAGKAAPKRNKSLEMAQRASRNPKAKREKVNSPKWREVDGESFRGVDIKKRFREKEIDTGLEKIVTLKNYDFSRCDLEGADFTKVNLQGSRFRGANIKGVKFALADLRWCDFTDSNWDEADFGDDGIESGTGVYTLADTKEAKGLPVFE